MHHCLITSALPPLNVMPPSCALLHMRTHAYKCSELLIIWCPCQGLAPLNFPHLLLQVAWTSCWLPTQCQTGSQALHYQNPGPRNHCWRKNHQAVATALTAQVNKVVEELVGVYRASWHSPEVECNFMTVITVIPIA